MNGLSKRLLGFLACCLDYQTIIHIEKPQEDYVDAPLCPIQRTLVAKLMLVSTDLFPKAPTIPPYLPVVWRIRSMIYRHVCFQSQHSA